MNRRNSKLPGDHLPKSFCKAVYQSCVNKLSLGGYFLDALCDEHGVERAEGYTVWSALLLEASCVAMKHSRKIRKLK